MLLELEVHGVLATAEVLLNRDDHPVPEALRLVRVELDVDLRDDLVLLVEDHDDVGFVVDRRRPPQVVVAEPRGLETLLVRGDDRDHRDVLGQRDVLQAVDDERDLLGLGRRLGDDRHLLQVVDHHHQPAVTGELTVLADQLAHAIDRACRLRATQEEQVLPVAGDPVQ